MAFGLHRAAHYWFRWVVRMNQSGVLGDFQWVELPNDSSDIPAVVRRLSAHVIGLTAVNVSWDSGRMAPTREQEEIGWRRIGELAVSPVIDEALAANWPVSSCQEGQYDEWYFFRELPVPIKLEPFCNWCTSLANAADLAFPGGFDLRAQLDAYRPEIVVGDGASVFVISRHQAIIDLVRAGCEA
jgi:hypothetical protein